MVARNASIPSPFTAEMKTSDGRTVGRPDGRTTSDFVYTVTIGERGVRVSPAMVASGGAGYSASGCRYAITSASSMARRAAARMTSWSGYSGSSRPGESVKMYCVSSFVSRPTTGSRVDCGFGETIARCSPTSALRSVDLPTLGRPARTIVPQRVMVRSVEYRQSSREVGMMRTPVSVLALLLAATACARHAIPPVVLTSQTRLGPAEDYGPGILDVTPSDVDLRLDAPAYVIALRVTTELGIQVVAPVAGSPRSKRGTHYFRGGAVSTSDTSLRTVSSKSCTVRDGSRESCVGMPMRYQITQLKQGGATSDAPGYWLLIVSDASTPAHEVML